jgi:hypothetical protein
MVNGEGDGRDARQRDRAEVLLEVAEERVPDPLAEQHPTSHDHPAERAVGSLTQQEPEVRHLPELVDAHRDRVDVDQRHVGPDALQQVAVEPAWLGVEVDLGHEWVTPVL